MPDPLASASRSSITVARGPGPLFLSIEGRARVAPELNDQVGDGMIQGERNLDPERGGVAVVIELDSVAGAGADGFFQQTRA